MQSKISSSKGAAVPSHTLRGLWNGSLFRRNLRSFWPLWALYAAVWFIALPLMQGAQVFGPAAKHIPSEELAHRAAQSLMGVATAFNIGVCAVFGVLFAMVLFSYLCFARSVGTAHSLPIRREGLFLTNYLSGVAVFVSIDAAMLLITAVIQGAGGVLVWGNLLFWFACTVGTMLFFYSFAVFCVMFTGQLLAIPVFYTIFNFLAITVNVLVQDFASVFLYGYSGGGTPVWVRWFTPVWNLYRSVRFEGDWDETLGVSGSYSAHGLGTVGIYALVGLVFAALALLVYRRRKSESTGDTVAVWWAKPIFRYGVGACCALSLGLGLYVLIWDQLRDGVGYSLVGAVVCMVLAGMIGYFAAEMLVQKSFRVFKDAWKGALILAAAIVVFGVGLSLDVTGVERRLPAVDSVESIEITFGSQGWCEGVIQDADTIAKFREAHQTLIEEQAQTLRRQEEDVFSDKTSYEYGYTYLEYHLKNGDTVRRNYTIYYTAEELQNPDTAVAKLAALAVDPSVQRANILGNAGNIQRFTGGSFNYMIRNRADASGSVSFDAEAAQTIYEAIQKDIAAGHFGINTFDMAAWDRETYSNSVSLDYLFEGGEKASSQVGSLDIEFSSNATNLIAALRQYDITNEEHPLITLDQSRGETEDATGHDIVIAQEVPAATVSKVADVGIIGEADGPTAIFVN